MSSLNPELYCLVHISVFIFNLQASIKVSGLNSAADASLCKSFLIISAAVETIHRGGKDALIESAWYEIKHVNLNWKQNKTVYWWSLGFSVEKHKMGFSLYVWSEVSWAMTMSCPLKTVWAKRFRCFGLYWRHPGVLTSGSKHKNSSDLPFKVLSTICAYMTFLHHRDDNKRSAVQFKASTVG